MAHLQKPSGYRSAAAALVHGRMHVWLGFKRGDVNEARLGAELIKQVMGLGKDETPSAPPEGKPQSLRGD